MRCRSVTNHEPHALEHSGRVRDALASQDEAEAHQVWRIRQANAEPSALYVSDEALGLRRTTEFALRVVPIRLAKT